MFQNTDEYNQLVSLYTADKNDDSFGLYLGAGINLPTEQVKKLHFDTYSWEELLRAIYNRNIAQYSDSFEKLKSEHPNDWPGLAEAVVGKMTVEEVVSEIDLIIYHSLPRSDKKGSRLSRKMLKQAPTMHAAICFATRIKDTWTFERNPKIGTVITPNYDFFFGAGWTGYQAFSEQWKVITPFSKGRPKPGRRCIYYIHGYIPYELHRREKLVLTKESYESAYNERDGFARMVLEYAVREYNLIFIGTSFGDKPVNQILKNAKEKRYGKQHFVIEKSPDLDKLVFFEKLGVTPIIVEEYAEIAAVLKALYSAGLEKSDWNKFDIDSKAYWERLKKGPDK